MQSKLFSKYFLLSSLTLLTVYAVYLLRRYLIAIIFAFIFAYLFSGTYDRFLKIVRKEWLAAGLVILVISLVFIIPLVWVVYTFVSEAQGFLSDLSTMASPAEASGMLQFMEDHLGMSLSESQATSILVLLSQRFLPFLERFLPSLLQTFSNLGIQIFICAFLLFYLLINKDYVRKMTIRYLPLTDEHSRMVLKETAKTTRALVIGQGLIALIQGMAGAIGYLIFDIRGAFLWGVMMAVGSFIPFVGTALIWLPAGIILIFQGDIFSGVGILIWGAVIVSNVDNLVRPKLVSVLGEIHPVVVLLGVFIGIAEFNLLGIILGPLLLQTLLLLYKLFKEEYIVG